MEYCEEERYRNYRTDGLRFVLWFYAGGRVICKVRTAEQVSAAFPFRAQAFQ